MKKNRRSGHWLFLLVCTAGMVLATLEGVARLYYLFQGSSTFVRLSKDPRLVFEPRPNQRFVNRFGQEVRVNALGLKGSEIEPRSQGEYRILAIGDSIMAGEYLAEPKRLPGLVADEIHALTGAQTKVWNGAVGGYNAWQELGILKTKIRQVDPDLVLVGVCANDFVPSRAHAFQLGSRVFILSHRDGSMARFFNSLYQRSDFYKLAYDSLHEIRLKQEVRKQGYEVYLKQYVASPDSSQEKAWEGALEEIVHLAREDGATPILIFFPLHSQVYRGDTAMNQTLFEWASEKGYPFIDLTGIFRKIDATGMSLFREGDFVHPNEKGLQIASKSVIERLKQEKLLQLAQKEPSGP